MKKYKKGQKVVRNIKSPKWAWGDQGTKNGKDCIGEIVPLTKNYELYDYMVYWENDKSCGYYYPEDCLLPYVKHKEEFLEI